MNIKQTHFNISAVLSAFALFVPLIAFAQNDQAVESAIITAFISIFGAIYGLWFMLVLTLMAVNIVGMIFWVVMIIDVAKREFDNDNDKTVWTLVVILTGWIGALIYYFSVKTKDKKQNESASEQSA